MLGCEYGCRDAVEVLVRNGADATLLDALGHDSSYYARIGDNLDILNLLKAASENTSKGANRFLDRISYTAQTGLDLAISLP